MAGMFRLAMFVFIQVLQQGGLGGGFASQTIERYVWIPSLVPENSIKISLLIDNLSALMLVLVSFLCLLIFIYSLGYMHEEDGKPRYYFFFQAEDGIRDVAVTGVQTCALPI